MSITPCTRLPPHLFVPPFNHPSVQSRYQETVPLSYYFTVPPDTPCHLLLTCRNIVAVLFGARQCHHRAIELPGAPPCHHRATVQPCHLVRPCATTVPPSYLVRHRATTVPRCNLVSHRDTTVPP